MYTQIRPIINLFPLKLQWDLDSIMCVRSVTTHMASVHFPRPTSQISRKPSWLFARIMRRKTCLLDE